MRNRVGNLARAAATYGISCPTNYNDAFDDDLHPGLSKSNEFRLSLADKALNAIVDVVMTKADELLRQMDVPTPSAEESQRIYNRFSLVVPAEGCASLADIINAGWRASLDPALWENNPQVLKKRDTIIKELTIKTIEVFQIEKTPP